MFIASAPDVKKITRRGTRTVATRLDFLVETGIRETADSRTCQKVFWEFVFFTENLQKMTFLEEVV